MSWIDSRNWKISSSRHFQNGHHNIAKIQHWPISSQFDMWVDNDVLNWFSTLNNFYRSPFSKCITKIQHCPISSQFDMWVDNDVLNWFPTLNNFYRMPFSKWPPQYHTNSTLSDFNAISYVGRLWFLTSKNFYWSPFSKWPPQYRTNSTLFDFNVLNWFPTSKNFYRSPFSKWPPQYRKNPTLFDFKGSFWFIFQTCCLAGLGDSIIVRLWSYLVFNEMMMRSALY